MNAAQPIRYPTTTTKLVSDLCGPPRPWETEEAFGKRMQEFEANWHTPRLPSISDSLTVLTERGLRAQQEVLDVLGRKRLTERKIVELSGRPEATIRTRLAQMLKRGVVGREETIGGARVWFKTGKGKA